MLSYAGRRLAYAVLTFFGITVATFVLVHAVPGDPVTFYLARSHRSVPPAALEAIRREHHLDEPLARQYVRWVRGIATLDFGRSTTDRREVTEKIRTKLPNTFVLNLLAFLLAAGIGVPLGVWTGAAAGRGADRACSAVLFLLYSLPSFWVALLLMHWLAVRLELLPLFGMVSDDHASMPLAAQAADRLRHMFLPVLTLAYAQVAMFARFSRSAVAEVIAEDYIVTARAKGAGELAVIWRHALRNALVPLVSLFGLVIPTLISGSVIVETIFQWDGIGRLYYDSILARDYPTILALTVATALVTLFASLAADLLYAAVDPRIRVGRGST